MTVIKDSVAIVTGGATGIGRETALAMARRGAKAIALFDIDLENGEDAAATLRDEGAEAELFQCDVANETDFANAVHEVKTRWGRIDILHNNAGILSGAPLWPQTPVSRLTKMIAINLGGVVIGTRLVIDIMKEQRRGVILNTASKMALMPSPIEPVYAATKAAIIAFTKSVAQSVIGDNIRVNAILPGLTETPIIMKSGDGTGPAEFIQQVMDRGMMVSAEAVAKMAADLIEDPTKLGECVIADFETVGH